MPVEDIIVKREMEKSAWILPRKNQFTVEKESKQRQNQTAPHEKSQGSSSSFSFNWGSEVEKAMAKEPKEKRRRKKGKVGQSDTSDAESGLAAPSLMVPESPNMGGNTPPLNVSPKADLPNQGMTASATPKIRKRRTGSIRDFLLPGKPPSTPDVCPIVVSDGEEVAGKPKRKRSSKDSGGKPRKRGIKEPQPSPFTGHTTTRQRNSDRFACMERSECDGKACDGGELDTSSSSSPPNLQSVETYLQGATQVPFPLEDDESHIEFESISNVFASAAKHLA